MTIEQSFKTDAERSAWIITHADYFTVIRFKDRRYQRVECPSHAAARWLAQRMVEEIPDSRFLLYAVAGVQSCYVETVTASPGKARRS